MEYRNKGQDLIRMIYDCKRNSEKMKLIYISFFVAQYTLILLGLHDHTFLLLPNLCAFLPPRALETRCADNAAVHHERSLFSVYIF